MERSIDELLNGTPAETQEAPAPEPEAQAEDQPRDEHGRFAAKEQTGVEEPEAQPETVQPQEPEAGPPPADQLPRDVYEPLKAVRNENRELKAQIEALNQRFATMQQPPAPQEAPPNFWDDPDKAIEARITQATELAIQRYQQQQTVERITASEAAAKGRYADYDDAFHAFRQAASANPTLLQQMTSAADPAEFAYKTGKRSMDLEKLGGLDELLKAERAKWEAEAKAAIPAAAQSFPATTAADGSVGGRSGPAWAGPRPLDDLLR